MRQKYIDLLRQIALFYMIFQHFTLALLKDSDNTGLINFLYELVPICPALFLFISGFSLTISKKNYNNNLNIPTFMHLFKRGLLLILCSMFLFFVEYGIQLPDLIISPGILNSIGWMLIISGLILQIKYKKIIIVGFIIILVTLTILLELLKINIIPFNNGYEPMSPTIIFGFIGVLIGLLINDNDNFYIFTNSKKHINYLHSLSIKNVSVLMLGIIGLIILIFYFLKYGAFKIFFSDIGRYTIQRLFNDGFMPENLIQLKFHKGSNFYTYIWNYKSNCFFASLGAVFFMFSITHYLEKFLQVFHKNIFLPGQFAFMNYFFHLIILGILVSIYGYNKFNLNTLLFVLGIIYIASYIASYILLILKQSFKK